MGRVREQGSGVFWADRSSAAMRDQSLLDCRKGAVYRAFPFYCGNYLQRRHMQRPNPNLTLDK